MKKSNKKRIATPFIILPIMGIAPILPGDEGDDERDDIKEKIRQLEEELSSQNYSGNESEGLDDEE